MKNERCQRCCANCRFAMPVEHQGEPLLVCPYRQECRGRLTAVEPQEGCPKFRERVQPPERPGEGTCLIPLVNCDGLCALVDAADYEWLSRYTWRAVCARGGTFYACTYCEGKLCYMHRMIVNPPQGMVVDHKNRYGLDNHRVNLRNATRGQNNINRACGTGVSGFRGVSPCGDKWQAQIGHQRRTLRIGVFDDPAEAARAYDRKAVELHGEFACLNFPQEAGRRIVCLRGTARVCRAVAAQVWREMYRRAMAPVLIPALEEVARGSDKHYKRVGGTDELGCPCLRGGDPCTPEDTLKLRLGVAPGSTGIWILPFRTGSASGFAGRVTLCLVEFDRGGRWGWSEKREVAAAERRFARCDDPCEPHLLARDIVNRSRPALRGSGLGGLAALRWVPLWARGPPKDAPADPKIQRYRLGSRNRE